MGKKKNLQYETRIGQGKAAAARVGGGANTAPEAPQLRTWFDHQRNVMVVEVVEAPPCNEPAPPHDPRS